MGDGPLTRPSLLLRVRDAQDAGAWGQFVDRYGPLVYQFARKRGLQDADAADLTQDVMSAVAVAIKRLEYDRGRGTFRAWLYTVVRHQLQKFWARQRQAPRGTGDTGTEVRLEQEPDRAADELALWNQEFERQTLHWAMEQVRHEFECASWQAFWQTAVEGRKAPEAARRLGMTVGAVYTAKSRVLSRVKLAIQSLQEEED